MTWQSHVEHSVSWLSPSCAKVVIMVGKGKAAVTEKLSPVCKVAEYIITWLQRGNHGRGEEEIHLWSQSVFDPNLGRHIVRIAALVWAQHCPALPWCSGSKAHRGWQHITQRPGPSCRCCSSADRAASRAAVARAQTCPDADVDCNTAGCSELILSHHDNMQPASQG